MANFSITHWLIILMIIGIPTWLIVRARRQSSKQTNAVLTGIGGWLGFLAVILCLGFLRSLTEFFQSFQFIPDLMKVPAARLPTIIGVCITVIVLALHLWVIVALFQKRRYFARLFLGFWISSSLMVLPALLMLTVPGVTIDHMAESIGSMIGAFVVTGLWVWYTRVSVRVRNTMVT